MTSGYAAFSTNISLHAKENIVQSCNIGGKTIKTITEGDGLYKGNGTLSNPYTIAD